MQKIDSIKDEAISKIDQSSNGNNEKPLHHDDGKKHMPYHDDKKSGSRCKYPKCKQFTHVFCGSCKKYLCFTRKRNCFTSHHMEN